MDDLLGQRIVSPYRIATAVVAASLLLFLFKGYVVRSKTLRLRAQGLAMPPLNPIFGHLFVLARIMSKLPHDAHPHYLPDQLRRAYPDMGPIFYLDAWPFMSFTLIVASPSTLSQITTEHTLPKFPAIQDFLYPLTHGRDIVSMDGQEWKYWRSMFNPGFSASHLMTVVPDIVRGTVVFSDILKEQAEKQDVFAMKMLTDNLAMDVIGKVVLDSNLNCQRSSNPMVNALRSQMRWMAFGGEGNPLQQYHPLRPLVHIYNTWQMNKYISPEVAARFAIYKDQGVVRDPKPSKSVVDLALNAYLKQNASEKPAQVLDNSFKELALNQVKLFLFSGHDTTSSTICYIIYLLSQHPNILSRVRAEHDIVFGADMESTAARMTEDPYLLNKLPFTVAVIKESMRLFPAASTTRSGEAGFNITDARGHEYPTDGCLVWLISHAVQHDPAFWPQPDDFLPERWLTDPGDRLHPIKGAWRPFEYGPRACIGVELSMIEIKCVMALVARQFNITPVYDESDAAVKAAVIRTVDGERAYQLKMGQPSENLPCRVAQRDPGR